MPQQQASRKHAHSLSDSGQNTLRRRRTGPKTAIMAHMSSISRGLQLLALGMILWFCLQACSTMEGKLAPTLVPGELVLNSPVGAQAELPEGGWMLLNFFGPD
jgi:hypothetical protein